jgi:hypothetical protein
MIYAATAVATRPEFLFGLPKRDHERQAADAPIIPDLQPIDGLKYTADCTHTLVGKEG